MFTKYRTVLMSALLAVSTAVTCYAQQYPYNINTKPPRGVLPNSDLLTSPLDSIDPISGRLHLQIPLAALPAGNAGWGFDLALVYNSNLFDLTPYEYLAHGNYVTRELRSNNGGWNYNFRNYTIDVEARFIPSWEAIDCSVTNSELLMRQERFYRHRISLPDGSQHILHLFGYGDEPTDQYWGDGFYPFSMDGMRSGCAAENTARYPQNLLNQTLTWYTTDGSYLRFQMQTDGNPANWPNQQWTLFYPDGRRVTGSGFQAQYLYDANGNVIRITNSLENGKAVSYIWDEFNRSIRLESGYTSSATSREDKITVTGPNGPLEWRVKWQRIQVGSPTSRYVCFEDTTVFPVYEIQCGINIFSWVVQYIQLPQAAPMFSPPPEKPWTRYEFGYPAGSGTYGHLSTMRVPTGALYQYSWAPGPSWHPYYPLFESDGIAYGGYEYRHVTHDGVTDTWTYGRFSNSAIAVNPDGGLTRYWFYDPIAASDAWMRGLVYKIEEPNGTVRKRQWARNKVSGLAAAINVDPNNPYIERESVTVDAVHGQPRSAVTDYLYDKNGNLLSRREYDWSSYNQGTAMEPPGLLLRAVDLSYHVVAPAANVVSTGPSRYWAPSAPRRLDAVRRHAISGTTGLKALAEFEYDNPLANGNITVERRWDDSKPGCSPTATLAASNCPAFRRAYHPNGNLADIFEPSIRTHVTYQTGPYPTRVEYGEPGTEDYRRYDYTWNLSAGVLNAKADTQNGFTTHYAYDAFGRLQAETEGTLRRTQTLHDDEHRTVTVTRDLAAFGDGKLQSTAHQDELGRIVLLRTSDGPPLSPAGNDGIKVKSVYGTFNGGTRTVASTPHRSTSDVTLEWNCSERDQLGRVTVVAMFKGPVEPTDCRSQANRTGIATIDYSVGAGSPRVRRTDPAGRIRDEYYDAVGRTVWVVEAPEGPEALGHVTGYTYDPLNNLNSVMQQGDGATQARTFSYTSMGRLRTEVHPESGITQFTYEDSGSLKTRVDARGVLTTYSYDALHRLRSQTYLNDGGSTPNVAYTYHTAAPNFGRLHTVSSAEGTTTYGAYDQLGGVLTHTQTIPGGGSYTFAYTYWLNDALKSLQYPSGRVIAYDTDDAGRTAKVRLGIKTYADMTGLTDAYAADGRLLKMHLGNELWETREYPAPGSPTVFKVGTAPGLGDKHSLEFYLSPDANNGNILGQTIVRPGATGSSRTWIQEYPVYDGANRLKIACERLADSPASSCGSGWIQHFGYDRYGNRWVEPASSGLSGTDVHEPTATSNFDKQTNRLYLQNSAYDNAGNQVQFTPFTLEYDAENRVRSMSSPANGSGTFSYDGQGRRVKKVWTNGTTTVTHYVYTAFGRVAAEYSSQPVVPGTSYIHHDFLGSVRTITGNKPADWPASTAPILECYDYVPFGRMIRAADNGRDTGCYPSNPDYPYSSRIPQKFTGRERDAESRLDYFGARYYSPAEGRFTSPDPQTFSSKTIANPQAWNRYVYTVNNPLKYVDPDGKDFIAAFFLGEQYRDVSTFDAIFGRDTVSDLKKAWGNFLDDHRTVTRGLSPFPTSAKEAGVQMATLRLGKYAGPVISKLGSGAEKAGRTVLGKVGRYEAVAEKLGANSFVVKRETWEAMSAAEKWAANKKFLDEAIARGDEFILADPVKDIGKISGYFRKELDYLIEKGFRLSEDGTRMIR